jgi:hypothetical protein
LYKKNRVVRKSNFSVKSEAAREGVRALNCPFFTYSIGYWEVYGYLSAESEGGCGRRSLQRYFLSGKVFSMEGELEFPVLLKNRSEIK